MPAHASIRVGPLRDSEVSEADRIVRLAFGTFIGVPDPLTFMGDRSFLKSRWGAPNVNVLAARDGRRLIGSNVATRWGSFAFFGPLTVLPEYWDRGVAHKLLAATMKIFARWGVRRTALYTFAQSPKHLGLYQKFGYWPQYLTAILTRTPEPANSAASPVLLSTLSRVPRERAIQTCARITNGIDPGLHLSDEIRAALTRGLGDVLLSYRRGVVDAFAVCFNGPGSEGGEKVCYIKFAAARRGRGAGDRFSDLLHACDAFAASRGLTIEAGVNLAREDAYRRIRSHGYRATALGVAMQQPNAAGHNRADAYVLDDWR
jgi:GNAT superfamily N-acetyltransferase